MRKKLFTTLIALALVAPAAAMDQGKVKGEMDHSAHDGKLIHESTSDGYRLAYHVIDNMAAMAEMGDIQARNARRMRSHHLMVYVVDSNGKKLSEGKVGYKVTGPLGMVQKTMATAMLDGFGADVDLKTKGIYTVQTKVVAGNAKLADEFTYEVK